MIFKGVRVPPPHSSLYLMLDTHSYYRCFCICDNPLVITRGLSSTHKRTRHNCTLEKHCIRTSHSLRGGCSRRVHKIVYLAVKKGNILVNILLLKIFIANYCRLLIQLCTCLTNFCGLSDRRYRARGMPKYDIFLKKGMKENFAYVLEFMLTLAKMQNNSTLM